MPELISKLTLVDQTVESTDDRLLDQLDVVTSDDYDATSDWAIVRDFLSKPENRDLAHDFELCWIAHTQNLPLDSSLLRNPVHYEPKFWTWNSIREHLKSAISQKDTYPLPEVSSEVEGVFFRNKKDASLRRLRYDDLPQTWQLYFLKFPTSVDYIWRLNMTLWVHLSEEPEEAKATLAIPGLLTSLDVFTSAAKSLTNELKKGGYHGSYAWRWCVEMQNLVGFRTYPDPAIKIQPLVQDFTNDVATDVSPNVLDIIANMAHRPLTNTWMSFEDFIRSPGLWATSGRSRFPNLKMQIGEEVVKVVLKKNLIPFVLTPDELLLEMDKWARRLPAEDNFLLIKEEPGKIRLAVGADDQTYLVMSWIYHLVEGWSLGNCLSMGEDALQELQRMLKWCRELLAAYTLPFDFANFERQVAFKAISAVWMKLVSLAAKMGRFTPYELRLISHVDRGIYNVRLHNNLPLDGKGTANEVLHPKGGLSSGILITSTVGSLVNYAFSARAAKLLGINPPRVRGDDAAWFGTLPAVTLAYIVMRCFGYKASPGKFSILRGETEFLRETYTKDAVIGYPARSIIALTQRKPWSDGDWNPTSVFSDFSSNLQTMIRRGASLQRAQTLNLSWARKYAKMLSIDVDLILAPQDLGGFGGSIVTNNQYRWVHKPAFFPMVNFQPFNQKIASWNNTSPLSQALDEERMRSIVLASGGPTVHKIIRVQFNTWLREAQHTKFNRDLPKLNPKFNKAILNELDRWKEKDFEIITKKVRNIPFFSDPDLARDLRDRRLIGNDHKLSTRSKSLLSFAKNLGFSRREVEDLSKGEIHVNVNNPYLAPKFRQLFTSIVLLVTYRALLTARIIQKTSMQLVLDRVGLLVYLTSKRVSGLTTFYRS